MERRDINAIEAVLQRERFPYRSIAVRPLSPVIGAEVEGVDLRLRADEGEVAELRRALLEHHVLVFRDQRLSAEEHVRVAALFGFALEPGRRQVTAPTPGSASTPEPLMLGDVWRADETYLPVPPAGGVLHIQKVPPQGVGGDMMFANVHLAHELLSEPLKDLLSDLTAVHVAGPDPKRRGEGRLSAEHPVVISHPVTGRPAIFVNRRHTSHIVQLEPDHGEATLDMLCRHLEAHPVLTCRIRWTPDALVVWDNRSTQHLTLQDFTPSCLSGHLVSLAGTAPAAWAGKEPANIS